MLCQNSMLFRFFLSSGNKETIVEICLTIEVTQSSLVFVTNDEIMHIVYGIFISYLRASVKNSALKGPLSKKNSDSAQEDCK